MRVFLGGTVNSNWRSELIRKLIDVDYFNPVVDEWTDEDKQNEIIQYERCDYALYTITPEMVGVFSIAEAIDSAYVKRGKTLFCILKNYGNRTFSACEWKSLLAVADLLKKRSTMVFMNLQDVASYLNERR